jgi:hypothetical protein
MLYFTKGLANYLGIGARILCHSATANILCSEQEGYFGESCIIYETYFLQSEISADNLVKV